jgi:plastocyanin
VPGGTPAAPAAGGDAAKAAAPAAGDAAAAAVIEPGKGANTAAIAGTIKVSGTVPAPLPVSMVAKPECVAAHGGKPVLSDSLIAGAGNELKDAFVWVKKGLEGKKFPPPTEPAVIDQRGCMYSPHVLGVRVGQDIKVLNSDPFSHNVNVKENNPFNLAMTSGQAPEIKPRWFRKEGVPTKFQCDIHSWMSSYACVVNHPYWALTGPDGKFEIKGLPAGKYTIAVWHEPYPGLAAPAQKEVEVEVKAGETKAQDFTYTLAK